MVATCDICIRGKRDLDQHDAVNKKGLVELRVVLPILHLITQKKKSRVFRPEII